VREGGEMSSPDDPMKQLAKYFFRANLMHDFLHVMMDDYDGDIGKIHAESRGWEFETYLVHWLSGLFVVVEGFNKLKLKDARVQKLFKEHVRYLKAMRHETYHFSPSIMPEANEVIRQLNWAEELHDALESHISEYVLKKAREEQRAKKKKAAPKKKLKMKRN
jgi:hypothetical protein